MNSRKLGFMVLMTLAFCMGCQPATNHSLPLGSTGRGRTTSTAAAAGKVWASITGTQGDAAFDQQLYYFTAPTLSSLSADDQLGSVSSLDGQTTGVRFWGNVQVTGTTAVANTMAINIEIYDDRTGQTRTDGTIRPPVATQISSNEPAYVGSGGTVTGGQVNLWWQDQYGTILMQGTINGQTVTGQIGYSDSYTGNQSQVLGNFTVPVCGFFVCQ